MLPSEVRTRIQGEHRELRALLARLGGHVSALKHGARAELPTVLAQARALSRRLSDHVDLEDAVLAPALRDTDAWGAQRAAELVRHHELQRRDISQLLEILERLSEHNDPATVVVLVRTVRSFANELERDMHHEDRELLNDELLRDDVVGIAVEDG